MKIELDNSMVHAVAKEFANFVHGRVVQRHLKSSWGIWEDGALPCLYLEQPWERERLNAMRRAIRSIKDPWERRAFIHQVRFLFQRQRIEQGTLPRWQDSLALTHRAHASYVAEQQARAQRLGNLNPQLATA